ncbi:MAG: adenine deaminase, partial [Bdellovibrionales bacterium]|nr:adenine deaminase [Bdellovibrionales bacterium]
ILGVQWLDVFSGRFREGDITICDGVIVGTESGLPSKRKIQGKGKWLVPGFIDAHVHVESSMMTPVNFSASVLKCGTTSAICDPHELANVRGVSGIDYFLKAAEVSEMDLRVMLSSCVPATHMETNGGGVIGAKELLPFIHHPKALGLAEVMNVPGVLLNDPSVHEKLEAFLDLGKPIDGHSPMLRGKALSAYAAACITSCHESSELDEAEEKLQKGIAVWIREGSVAKDLERLIPLLNMATSSTLGFCTDDRNPLDIATEGHIDYLIRQAIRHGVAPEVAFRAASWSVARHYGLDRGLNRVGAIAPGYRGDLVLLNDLKNCAIAEVFSRGRVVSELQAKGASLGSFENSIRTVAPDQSELMGPSGNVHVIHVMEGKIITGRSVQSADAPGVSRLSVLERYGQGQKPANGYVHGFGTLRGAIASSVGHDSHNLIAVGQDPAEMKVAMQALIDCGGGFCVVSQGKVAELLPLPLGGLMSERSPSELKDALVKLKAASRSIGCEVHEPFLQLAFLSLPVIPSLKLTDRGLVDVDQFKIIDVRAG